MYATKCLVLALETLHGNNIIYRALQPESVHIDNLGHVVLIDYRVCKLGVGFGERTFTVCGLAEYLAPEQISQTGHSYPVDLWGLGILLYEMACGINPFHCNR
jgi:serine/threonine protein kinase